MNPSDDEHKIIKFENLNLLGKLVFMSGVVTRSASTIVKAAVDATSEIIAETEKAFKEGLDSDVEDAKIIDEVEEKE